MTRPRLGAFLLVLAALPLVHAIVRAHGWSVHAEEGEAGGTRIVFTGVDVVARTPAATASTDD